MAMGTRRKRERQRDLWIATSDVVETPANIFYDRLNQILDEHKFDAKVERLCQKFYKKSAYGRPSLAPGVYFRSLLIGFFEGLDSERGIAWRTADSLSLRKFLGYVLDEATPDHSTISRTRRLYWLETHKAVFRWVLKILDEEGLISGRTVSIDATTLEANAALKSIVRRDNGQSYHDYLKELAMAAGIENPTREQLARLDRKRKKKGSNQEWESATDPDARIAKMKDGSTHMAHKAEHAVDMESGAVIAVTLQAADQGDTTTIHETLAEAGQTVAELIEREAEQAPEAKPQVHLNGIMEIVTDKGYHSGPTVVALREKAVRTYIPEPKRGRRQWAGKTEEQQAVYANRRRVQGHHGKHLLKKRGELIERSFAHCYETGGMRRTHLRGRENILKRQLIHVGAFNLSLIFRLLQGAGTPRELRNRRAELISALMQLRIVLQVLQQATGDVQSDLYSFEQFPRTRLSPFCLELKFGGLHHGLLVPPSWPAV